MWAAERAGWCAGSRHSFPPDLAAGMDVSDAMLGRAESLSAQLPNVVFARGGVDAIPWETGYFTKVLSVESAYYWPDPAQGVREIFRVLSPGGAAWILINYYRDNPHCHQWGGQLKVPTLFYCPRRSGRTFSAKPDSQRWTTAAFPTVRLPRKFTPGAGSATRSKCGISSKKVLCCSTRSIPRERLPWVYCTGGSPGCVGGGWDGAACRGRGQVRMPWRSSPAGPPSPRFPMKDTIFLCCSGERTALAERTAST